MGRDDQGVARSAGRRQVIPRTLSFITHDDAVLLLRGGPHKKLWAGLYNGVGGHVEAGEDIYSAALREIREETGLAVHDMRLCGVLHIDAGDPLTGILIFVFTATAASRVTIPSSEGELFWIPRDNLPVENVVEDLPLLLARVLRMQAGDEPFSAAYSYDAGDRLQISFANVP